MRTRLLGPCSLVLCMLLAVACTDDDPAPPQQDAGRVEVTDWLDDDGWWDEPPSTRCTGRLVDGRVVGDLLVPEGESCTLVRTLVSGRTTVDRDGSLVARGSFFGEGIGARSFRRIELGDDRRPRRAPRVREFREDFSGTVTDFVFEDGRSLTAEPGADLSNARVIVMGMRGPVQIRDLFLDLGSITCLDNEVEPRISGISAESPGVLRGQCAGPRNFGDTDF